MLRFKRKRVGIIKLSITLNKIKKSFYRLIVSWFLIILYVNLSSLKKTPTSFSYTFVKWWDGEKCWVPFAYPIHSLPNKLRSMHVCGSLLPSHNGEYSICKEAIHLRKLWRTSFRKRKQGIKENLNWRAAHTMQFTFHRCWPLHFGRPGIITLVSNWWGLFFYFF